MPIGHALPAVACIPALDLSNYGVFKQIAAYSMSAPQEYVKWFRNSAPYINAHRQRTFVVMLGGEAVADDNIRNIVHDFALLHSLGVRLVVVAGARVQIDAACASAGIEASFHEGRRITCGAQLPRVIEASGSVRARLEALFSMGLANSPMHGARISVCSGNFVSARPLGVIDGVDFQHTGTVRRIDTRAIARLLDQQQLVLLSPLGFSPSGEIFNLTAEEVAARTAIALNADKFIAYSPAATLTDSSGAPVNHCDMDRAAELIPLLAAGSAERVVAEAAVTAARGGVPRCHVISHSLDGALLQELFSRDGCGTLITSGSYENLAKAGVDDIGGILAIIEPLEADGTLVKRSRETLEQDIDHYSVILRDGMVVACAALHVFPDEDCAEIACVATHPDYRDAGRAERLLAALEASARQQQLARAFVLTTQSAHWFIERGYSETNPSALPADKQRLYNYRRNSKILVKQLD